MSVLHADRRERKKEREREREREADRERGRQKERDRKRERVEKMNDKAITRIIWYARLFYLTSFHVI